MISERDATVCQLWREGYKAREIAARVGGGLSVANTYQIVRRRRLAGEDIPLRFAPATFENYNKAFRARLRARAADVRNRARAANVSGASLLNYKQAAALMGVHESTLRRGVRSGSLRYETNNGWNKRFRLVDLLDWAERA